LSEVEFTKRSVIAAGLAARFTVSPAPTFNAYAN
jgi:hypothetical protein